MELDPKVDKVSTHNPFDPEWDPDPLDLRRLAAIWEDQALFNLEFREQPRVWEERCAQTKEIALCLHSEVDDLLKAIKWKPHVIQGPRANPGRVMHELGDIFRYLITLCQIWGVSPEELMMIYWTLSPAAWQSRKNLEVIRGTEPIAIVDIDGVLCDYPDVGLVAETAYERWEKAHRLRASGKVRELPVKEGAREFLSRVEKAGYLIALITSRPVDSYPQLREQTVLWLLTANLRFHCLWFSKKKHEELLSQGIEGRVKWAVEDSPVYAKQLAGVGIPVWFLGEWDNVRYGFCPSLITPVQNLEDIRIDNV